MKSSVATIVVGIIVFTICAFLVLYLLQERERGLLCDEADGCYAMMFAFQYSGGGAYYVKIDDDLFIWACRGPIEGEAVTEEDFANPELNWRKAQITQENFDCLVSLTREAQPKTRRESPFSDDHMVLGAWTLTVFYDSSTFRGVLDGGRLDRLAEKIVELSPIWIDLTVIGGS